MSASSHDAPSPEPPWHSGCPQVSLDTVELHRQVAQTVDNKAQG